MALHFHPQPKPEPRAITKHKRRAAAGAELLEAYAVVDARDAGICWVTGRYTQPGHPDSRVRREHNHLRGRNVMPGWVTDPDHIVTVCVDAHRLITHEKIIVEGDDVRKAIRFHWREDVPKDQRIFHIQSRRRSQQVERDI